MSLQREFTLDEVKGPSRFSVIWNSFGFVLQNGQSKNIEVLRREAAISRKLRLISELKLIAANGIPEHQERVLRFDNSKMQKLTLDQPEIDLIRKKIEDYPYWNPLAEESPADVYDWLSTGRELDFNIPDEVKSKK